MPIALLRSVGLGPRARPAPQEIVTALLLTTALVGPWLLRNYHHSGALVLQTWVGRPMFQGLYVSRHLTQFLRGEKSLTDLDAEALSIANRQTARWHRASRAGTLRPMAAEVLADRWAEKMAVNEVLRPPYLYAVLALRNLPLAATLQMTWGSTAVLMLWNGPLLALAIAGWIDCRRRAPRVFRAALPLTALFAYTLGIHAVTWPQARYVMPAWLTFSAFAAVVLARARACRLAKQTTGTSDRLADAAT